MLRWMSDTCALLVGVASLLGTVGSDRAEQLQAIQNDFRAARDTVYKDIRAGKVKAGANGGYEELAELQRRTAKRVRELIDADPKDSTAFESIAFGIRELAADAGGPELYGLLAAYHITRRELGAFVRRPSATELFLREVAAKSPHVDVRGATEVALASRLARVGKLREADTTCQRILKDRGLADLHREAKSLLFEVHRLQLGMTIPELEGFDLQDKPINLTEHRGKVTLITFWATWCGPCMKMMPHERKLVERYAGRPFAIVGVNGDDDDDDGIRRAVEVGLTNWRSFKNFTREKDPGSPIRQISEVWNIREWPTVFLTDQAGVIRRIDRGMPEERLLDEEIERLVQAAESKQVKPVKK